MGHGIHGLVTWTAYSHFCGNVDRDFVEAPSQMLENWCWVPKLMQRFSSHCKTGEQIPKELANRIFRSKHVGKVITILKELRQHIIDMVLHMRKSGDDETNLAKYWCEMYTQLLGVEGPEAFEEPRLVDHRAFCSLTYCNQ
jgi:Zn-dependent oligopeptidase